MHAYIEDEDFDFNGSTRRNRLTQEKSNLLMDAFNKNPRPNQEERAELSGKLGMSTRSIQIWFQNRRAKMKRESNDPDLFTVKKSVKEEFQVIPEITSSNFKELCLPKYLDIPIRGQRISHEEQSRNDAIRKFWNLNREKDKMGVEPSKSKKVKTKPSDLRHLRVLDPLELIQESGEYSNMPELLPFKEIENMNQYPAKALQDSSLDLTSL